MAGALKVEGQIHTGFNWERWSNVREADLKGGVTDSLYSLGYGRIRPFYPHSLVETPTGLGRVGVAVSADPRYSRRVYERVAEDSWVVRDTGVSVEFTPLELQATRAGLMTLDPDLRSRAEESITARYLLVRAQLRLVAPTTHRQDHKFIEANPAIGFLLFTTALTREVEGGGRLFYEQTATSPYFAATPARAAAIHHGWAVAREMVALLPLASSLR